MQLNSLLLKTSLIFARNESEIVERESYLAIKTPTNPGYHWGNFLIFKNPPEDGQIETWKKLFAREFPYYSEIKHYVFAWDELKAPSSPEYLAHGMELEKSVGLVAKELVRPKHFNEDIIVRPLQSEDEWMAADELQTSTRLETYSYKEYFEFKRKQSLSYQKLVQKKQGYRFGAFLKGQLVADLGIFHENRVARYQNVATHPDFRNRGICSTLVYTAGQIILSEGQVDQMVMVADPDYHAARIYESVGFKPKEESYNLYWYKNSEANNV